MLQEEYLQDDLFFEIVPFGDLWPNATMASLSGVPSNPSPYETDMIRRVEEAWTTPVRRLSCEQVRLLLSQRHALEWLTKPILKFVEERHSATITNYSGEMVLLSLRAAKDLRAVAPQEFRSWLQSDFGWFRDVFGWDQELLDEAEDALHQARRIAAN